MESHYYASASASPGLHSEVPSWNILCWSGSSFSHCLRQLHTELRIIRHGRSWVFPFSFPLLLSTRFLLEIESSFNHLLIYPL
jgi:hypothetical protein